MKMITYPPTRSMLFCYLLVLLVGFRQSVTLLADENAPAAKNTTQGPTVRVAGIILKWLRIDKEANFLRGEKLIREAAAHDAKIVVTSEGFLDGYAVEDKTIPLQLYRSLGERIPGGKYYQRLAALAKELNIHLVVGLTEDAGKDRYNAAVMIGPDGELVGTYRKQHVVFEAIRNTAGTESTVFDTPYGRIGLLICADRWSPELARKSCENGAEAIIYLSGGSYGEKGSHNNVPLRSRENNCYCIFVHPVEFLVTGPDGSIIKDVMSGELGKHPPDNWFRTKVFDSHSLLRGMLITTEQIGSELDKMGVEYFDLPIKRPVK